MEGERPREPKENGLSPERATSRTSARASVNKGFLGSLNLLGDPAASIKLNR